MADLPSSEYDAVVVGSGFGGCMSALPLVEAGMRVLMLERGEWVERSAANWGEAGVFVLTPHYTRDGGFRLWTPGGWRPQGICACVGGPSVFYGGASFRFREADFEPVAEIAAASAAEWPIRYGDLEPYYGAAERLLGVAGESGTDPTEPFRSGPYPHGPLPFSDTGRLLAEAATGLGLRPFRIPMAIDASSCQTCLTCDAFACAVEAKNDLATRMIPRLLEAGMELRPGTRVARLEHHGGRVRSLEAIDTGTGARFRVRARNFVLAAGALATPQVILASGLDVLNPARSAIGRYLMRHCNGMIYGFFPGDDRPVDAHHKHVAIHDFYFGDPERPGLRKLGNLQQVMTPPASLLRAMLPRLMGAAATLLVRQMTGILVIAEDQPRPENRIELDWRKRDEHGVPAGRIHHRYTARDLAARRALRRRARQVLRQAGARFTLNWNVNTFSHAVGTMRMGLDPRTSPVDGSGRLRGVENVWVTDGSVFPSSAGVNPSLTIAANALRVGRELAAAA